MGDVVVVSCEEAGRNRLRVVFDNGVSCRLYKGEARRLQLRVQGVVPQEQYRMLMQDILGRRAVKRAMHLLEQMDRTEYKLRQKLADAEYPEECIDGAVAYVKRFHYLDDERYASSYVRYRQDRMSRRQMKNKLMERGVPRDIIEKVVEEEYGGDERSQIEAILEKRGFDPAECGQKEFQRTYQFLMRRGFSSGDVLRSMKREFSD